VIWSRTGLCAWERELRILSAGTLALSAAYQLCPSNRVGLRLSECPTVSGITQTNLIGK
jgi:hypothetical protein